MDVHLIDGTYELFRHYYALPSARDQDGREVGAVRGVLASVLGMISGGATHLAVATDHVIESFRNGLWPGYKTGAGIEPDLWAQFTLLEETLMAAGVVVWPMVEFEADDALAAGAAAAATDARVDRVLICTPDKDLAQCVRGTRITDHLLAFVDHQLAAVGLVIAHDAFDERRFAGAVLAKKRMEGARPHFQRHLIERGELAETLDDVERFDAERLLRRSRRRQAAGWDERRHLAHAMASMNFAESDTVPNTPPCILIILIAAS